MSGWADSLSATYYAMNCLWGLQRHPRSPVTVRVLNESSRLASPARNVKLVSLRPYSLNLRTAGKRYRDVVC
jgi:hypothetical protein